MPKIILATIITVIVLTAAIIGINFLITNKNIFPLTQGTSPNILYLTNPVTSFSGQIEAVRGNTITVSQEMTLNQIPSSKPQTRKITYSVLINDKTIINQNPETIPYLFKQTAVGTPSAFPVAPTSNITTKDLKAGQLVNVSSNTDLRSLVGNQFEATFINVSSKTILINGKITNIKTDEITVLGGTSAINIITGANPQTIAEKEYTITVNQDTEISGTNPSADPAKVSPPVKYALSDLKNNLQVIIYTNEDPAAIKKVTALLIRPIFPPGQNTSTASPSATLAPQSASPVPQKPK